MQIYSPSHISLLDGACVSCRQCMPGSYSVLPLITHIPCRNEKPKIFVLYQGCVYETIRWLPFNAPAKRTRQLLTCTSRVGTWKNTGTYLRIFFLIVQQPLVDQGLLIIKALRSHSKTPHSVGLLLTSDQPVAETPTWKHTTLRTDIHGPGGIRTRNPSKRATLDRAATGIGFFVFICTYRLIDRKFLLYSRWITRRTTTSNTHEVIGFPRYLATAL